MTQIPDGYEVDEFGLFVPKKEVQYPPAPSKPRWALDVIVGRLVWIPLEPLRHTVTIQHVLNTMFDPRGFLRSILVYVGEMCSPWRWKIRLSDIRVLADQPGAYIRLNRWMFWMLSEKQKRDKLPKPAKHLAPRYVEAP